ncbi:hypothetical protein [Acinetobacter rathckeae]|uniref:hypothetical protein n=1 Tax=Acinetobacter rathckeae TaxID=2605272 RepID=UPI0018A2E1F2|nr:hypothetical protein [Acinetobacter rathckeae]MBF7688604.1 hypothetical protein [Acinetobacter rathckeae]MBF7695851.1 hypothetical protein [Acinetobacter rathckeae]
MKKVFAAVLASGMAVSAFATSPEANVPPQPETVKPVPEKPHKHREGADKKAHEHKKGAEHKAHRHDEKHRHDAPKPKPVPKDAPMPEMKM